MRVGGRLTAYLYKKRPAFRVHHCVCVLCTVYVQCSIMRPLSYICLVFAPAGGAEAAGGRRGGAGQPARDVADALWPQAVRLVPPLVFSVRAVGTALPSPADTHTTIHHTTDMCM